MKDETTAKQSNAAQQYILSELEKLKQSIEPVSLEGRSVEDAMYARVMSKKFRKLKATPFVEEFVRDSVKIALKNDAPLAIGFVHGGTKPWHIDEYPEVDWSELFNIIFMVQWMRYVAAVYPAGVTLEYYSMDVCQERMNNLPSSETDQYSQSFMRLIAFVEQFLPENITITYRRYADDYEHISDYDNDLDEAIKQSLTKIDGDLPQLSEKQIQGIDNNVRPTEEQQADPLWREKVELIHMSIENTKAFTTYLEDRRFVPACPTPVDGTLAVGSTKRSMAKFWFGAGGLERKSNGSFNQIVITPNQLKDWSFEQQPVSIPGLEGKNFSKIRIADRSVS